MSKPPAITRPGAAPSRTLAPSRLDSTTQQITVCKQLYEQQCIVDQSTVFRLRSLCIYCLRVALSIRQAASFSLSRDQACGLHLGSLTTRSETCWRAAAAAGRGGGGDGCCLCRYTVIDSVLTFPSYMYGKDISFVLEFVYC